MGPGGRVRGVRRGEVNPRGGVRGDHCAPGFTVCSNGPRVGPGKGVLTPPKKSPDADPEAKGIPRNTQGWIPGPYDENHRESGDQTPNSRHFGTTTALRRLGPRAPDPGSAPPPPPGAPHLTSPSRLLDCVGKHPQTKRRPNWCADKTLMRRRCKLPPLPPNCNNER